MAGFRQLAHSERLRVRGLQASQDLHRLTPVASTAVPRPGTGRNPTEIASEAGGELRDGRHPKKWVNWFLQHRRRPNRYVEHDTRRREETAMTARHSLTVATLVAVGAALLTSCGGSEPSGEELVFPSATHSLTPPVATTEDRGIPGVLRPYDTGVGRNGAEVSILSVTDEVTNYGPAAVFTFQIFNAGDQIIDEGDWRPPTVVYGAAGLPAEWFVSTADQLGLGTVGAIPPGSRQTVREGYKVSKAQLTEAVVTEGSLIWSGDFSTFQR